METIKSLIDQYGPAVVAAAQRQVQVDISLGVAWGIGLAIAVVTLGITSAWCFFSESDSYSNRRLAGMFTVMGAGFALVALVLVVSSTYSTIANPDWATIQKIRALVPR